MNLKATEAGVRIWGGASLGGEKSFPATLTSDHTPPHLALQERRGADRYGLPPEHARTVAELAYSSGKRR